MQWLAPIVAASQGSSRPVLVLCRTSATAAYVRRWLVRSGGGVGIEVATVGELAARISTGTAPTSPWKMPEGHPLEGVMSRPRLRATLVGHLEQIVIEQLPLHVLPREIVPLLENGWGRTRRTLGRLSLLEELDPPPFTATFALGFGDPESQLPRPLGPHRFHNALVDHLAATRLSAPPVERPEPYSPPVEVVDNTAAAVRWLEERVTARLQEGGRAGELLVLCPSEAVCRIVCEALELAEVPLALAPGRPLAEHGLSVIVDRLAQWMLQGEDPSVGAVDLAELVVSPLLSRRFHRQELPTNVQTLLDDQDNQNTKVWLTRALVGRVIDECRLVRAPLSHWIEALRHVRDQPNISPGVQRTAALIGVRALQLSTNLGSRIGDLLSTLRVLRLRTRNDTTAQLIVEQLHRHRDQKIDRGLLQRILARQGPHHLAADGITVLSLANYDGRDAEELVGFVPDLAHVGQLCQSDPLFSSEVRRTWGIPQGRDVTRFFAAQWDAAVRRCLRCAAVRRKFDDHGRGVVAIAELADGAEMKGGPQGYGLPSYHRRLARLRSEQPTTTVSVTTPTPGGLARGVEAEWCRFHVEGAPTNPLPLTLDERWPQVPSSAARYLGDARHYAAARLTRPVSATGTLAPLVSCMYRGYLQTVLRLRPRPRFRDPLDARDIGIIVHAALEATGGEGTRPRPDRLQQAVADRQLAVGEQLAAAVLAAMGATPTPAQQLAIEGVVGRWQRHLRAWVRWRVEPFDPTIRAELAERRTQRAMVLTETFRDALSRVHWPSERIRQHAIRWLRRVIAATGDPFGPEFIADVAPEVRQTLTYAATDAGFRLAIDRLRDEYTTQYEQGCQVHGPVVAEVVEWYFGKKRDDEQPLHLRFDEAWVEVVGAVDRLRLLGDENREVVEVVDYKTGRPRLLYELERDLELGLLPQLPLYAEAVVEATRQGNGPPGFGERPRPTVLLIDYIRQLDGGRIELPVDNDGLDETSRERLGALVQRARTGIWPLIPQGLRCPHHGAEGFCEFAASCRATTASAQDPGPMVVRFPSEVRP